MRVLFVSSSWLTHLLPMTPLAGALRGAGHAVWLATPPALARQAAATGLSVLAAGGDVDYDSVFASVLRAPTPPAASSAPGTSAGPNAPADSGGPRRPRVLGLFADAATRMLDELTQLVRSLRVGLVVFEPMALAAPLAAAAAGVPAVRFRFGPDALAPFLPALAEELAARGYGLDRYPSGPGVLAGTITLDPCPPGLRGDDPAPVLPIRYVPAWPGTGRLDPAALATSGRPRVCISWGSTLHRLAPETYLAGAVARALSTVDANVLVLARGEQAHAVGDLPANAILVRDVPLHQVVAHTDLVVSQGGAGAILTSALAERIQLTVPRLPDHRFHSGRLARTGAGRSIGPELLGERLAAEVAALLADPAAAAAARVLSASMREAPDPESRITDLTALEASPDVPRRLVNQEVA